MQTEYQTTLPNYTPYNSSDRPDTGLKDTNPHVSQDLIGQDYYTLPFYPLSCYYPCSSIALELVIMRRSTSTANPLHLPSHQILHLNYRIDEAIAWHEPDQSPGIGLVSVRPAILP